MKFQRTAVIVWVFVGLTMGELSIRAAEQPAVLNLAPELRERCLKVLRDGLRSNEFWPSIHAAEGLTLAGQREEVADFLESKLKTETDDQKRCGLTREIVRAGRLEQLSVLFEILANKDSNGRVHAAESLYKISRISNGRLLRQAFEQTDDEVLRLMAAAALGRCGSPSAMQYLRDQLSAKNQDHAMIAAWVLARIGNSSDIPALRTHLQRMTKPLSRVYFEHALANLGDEQGRKALQKNLNSDDSAVRTYAATFAGDARMFSTAGRLQELLDDKDVDVRVRAAQSLLMFSQPKPSNPKGNISLLVYEATKENPRNSEGSVIELNDGSLLFANTQFRSGTGDFAPARIVGRTSRDGGRTWGPIRELQKDIGKANVLGTTLRRLPPGTPNSPIGMLYSVTDGPDKIRVYLKVSHDEMQTFEQPILISNNPGYNMILADKMITLKSGRLVVPCSWAAHIYKNGHITSYCYLSDDGGRTWRRGKGKNVDLPKRGAMEPDVIELRDGRILMILRSQLGYIGTSYSKDGGETWSKPSKLSDLKAPEAPAKIDRIPATGDLLLIWNNNYNPKVGHFGKRNPQTAAISTDEGKTWKNIRNLESTPGRTYAYTSLTFVKDRVVMSYWDADSKYSNRFRSLPVSWFYEADAK